MTTDDRSWGRLAYAAFLLKLGQVAEAMPPWDQLSREMRAAWDAAGLEVAYTAGTREEPAP